MLQSMRASAKVVFWIVAITFVGGFLFAEISGLTSLGTGITRGTTIGEVDGEDISYDRWQSQVSVLRQQQEQRRSGPLSQDDQSRIDDIAFQQVVDSILLARELDRRNISISDEEIRWAAQAMPHPDLIGNPELQTEGRFDLEKYRRLIQSPIARQQGLTLFLEQYYRTELPRQKLFEQVAASLYVPDARLWRMWQDDHDSSQVSYVAWRPGNVPDSSVKVSDAEIEAYFRAHRKDFGQRAGRAVLSVISLARPVTAADSAAVRDRIIALRTEILGGAKFEDVARRESQDTTSGSQGGDLGTVGRRQFDPQFERAAFALRPGELSQPVLTQFGYHLIRVDERKADSIKVRHILLFIQQSDSSAAQTNRLADQIADMAANSETPAKFDSAARQFELPIHRVVATEGEPLSFNGKYVPDLGAWPFRGARAGDISDLVDAPEAFYLARIDSLAVGGEVAIEDVRDDIRRLLLTRKKVDALMPRAESLSRAVRSGKTLEQAAQEGGVQVERAPGFTRIAMVPGIGRLNEAIGAAFGLPVGATSGPIRTDDGVFVLRVERRVLADRAQWEAQKAMQREQLLQRLRRQRIQDFVAALRKSAKIEDHRREVLSRARQSAG